MSGLASAIEELAGEPLDGASTAGLGADLVELTGAMARLQAEFLRRLAAFAARGGAECDGSPSVVSWLREHCRLSAGSAADQAAVARRLASGQLPGVSAALAAGEIGYSHVRLLARVTEEFRPAVTAVEQVLLDTARRAGPETLATVLAHVRHAADARAVREAELADHDRRRLSVSPTLGGMVVIDGLLDAEGGAYLRTALAAQVAAETVPEDPRSPAQRRADALAALARRALDAGELPSSGGLRPHLSVLVELATLQARPGAPAGAWADGGALGAESIRRIGCDGALTRIRTDATGQPLDVGRTTRVVPPAIRRALVVRDRGCRYAGCDRPVAWTDAHHIRHWADGGPTSLTNLVLLCRYHHHAVHERGLPLRLRPVEPRLVPAKARAP